MPTSSRGSRPEPTRGRAAQPGRCRRSGPLEVARAADIVAHKGVFVAVPGPNLETRAEYRFLRMIGADVVGMSTVPEVIVAVHAGFRTLGISVITDLCLPETLEPASLEKILAVAAGAG